MCEVVGPQLVRHSETSHPFFFVVLFLLTPYGIMVGGCSFKYIYLAMLVVRSVTIVVLFYDFFGTIFGKKC